MLSSCAQTVHEKFGLRERGGSDMAGIEKAGLPKKVTRLNHYVKR